MLYRFKRLSVLVLLGAGIAAAQNKSYLALGDSIPWGFNPTAPLPDLPNLPDYHGYPQFVAASSNLDLTNASCGGETSASFINVTAPDNGCHEYRSLGGPLFVTYNGLNQSQLNFAIAYLRTHRTTKLVTITIGGDDLRLLQIGCIGQADPQVCELNGLGSVLGNYSKHLSAIYFAIRFEAGYFGPIVAANYFSPDYTNTLDDLAIGSLNAITLSVTAAFGGKVADVFSAFQAASVAGGGLPCAPAVGLAFVNPLPPGGCDVHPTFAGQQLIAHLVQNALK